MLSTRRAEIDEAVDTLKRRQREWAGLGIPARLDLLRRLRRDTLAAAGDWVAASCQIKRIDAGSAVAAEEWMAGPLLTIRNIRLLESSLAELGRPGGPRASRSRARTLPGGQIAVQVVPVDRFDRLLYAGFGADVWLEPGVDLVDVPSITAPVYRDGGDGGAGTVLVLGAGNVSSIGPMDVLSKMFVENRVCLLKMHPVNAALAPHLARSFHALIEAGFLRILRGDVEDSSYLVEHDGIDAIHITGSRRVHDEIVWGVGRDGDEARRSGVTRISKPITSELGCVTPVIIVPGEWTPRELRFQAENVATMIANNVSYNCNAARVLVTSAAWPWRDEFLATLKRILASLPPRYAYYPGSVAMYERFLDVHPGATVVGERQGDRLPFAFIEGVDPESHDDIVFRVEAWSPVVAETPITTPAATFGSSDVAAFLEHAVSLCNEHISGTLSCTLIVDPRTRRAHAEHLDRAIADLRYGSVVINHWPALSYAFCATPWGAFPGHTLEDVGSGIGFVHNTPMLERIHKAVVRGPFTVTPRPPWFVTHQKAHRVAPLLTRFEAKPSLRRLPGILLATFGG